MIMEDSKSWYQQLVSWETLENWVYFLSELHTEKIDVLAGWEAGWEDKNS